MQPARSRSRASCSRSALRLIPSSGRGSAGPITRTSPGDRIIGEVLELRADRLRNHVVLRRQELEYRQRVARVGDLLGLRGRGAVRIAHPERCGLIEGQSLWLE